MNEDSAETFVYSDEENENIDRSVESDEFDSHLEDIAVKTTHGHFQDASFNATPKQTPGTWSNNVNCWSDQMSVYKDTRKPISSAAEKVLEVFPTVRMYLSRFHLIYAA